MIRIASAEDIPAFTGNMPILRIGTLMNCYGEQPFLRFYTDLSGGVMSVYDGNAVLWLPDSADSEEWSSFIQMCPDCRTLRTTAAIGSRLSEEWGIPAAYGLTLRASSSPSDTATADDFSHPEAVYQLLCSCFSTLPAFDSWYVDVSHRLRHGYSMAAVKFDGDLPVSFAMTVAQSEKEALIGSVATHPDYRRRGLATACIAALINRAPNKAYYIEPKTPQAQKLYESIGFTPCGDWTQMTLSL